ncbi:hypothetical protein T310_8654, partial [Rasamsonia emersonii CBS 393.64]
KFLSESGAVGAVRTFLQHLEQKITHAGYLLPFAGREPLDKILDLAGEEGSLSSGGSSRPLSLIIQIQLSTKQAIQMKSVECTLDTSPFEGRYWSWLPDSSSSTTTSRQLLQSIQRRQSKPLRKKRDILMDSLEGGCFVEGERSRNNQEASAFLFVLMHLNKPIHDLSAILPRAGPSTPGLKHGHRFGEQLHCDQSREDFGHDHAAAHAEGVVEGRMAGYGRLEGRDVR